MVIKASSAREIDGLISDLSSDNIVKRDAAVARLTVIGSRAVDRLVEVASNIKATASARVAAFRSLEGIGEPRALQAVVAAFADADPSVAVAALNTSRVFLQSPKGVEALDRVIGVALDRRRPLAARIAAIQSLSELRAETVRPILTALKSDPEPEIANVILPPRTRAAMHSARRLEAAAEGTFPAHADVLKSAIVRSGADVPVAALLQIIERVRVREGSESPEARAGWVAARAAAHLTLAHRGSRVALYDLRETIEATRERLPVEFLAAVMEIGDISCLEPIAAAYAHVKDDWSRRHLTDAFRAIVDREKLTKRHPVAKKIAKRWPGTWEKLVASRQSHN